MKSRGRSLICAAYAGSMGAAILAADGAAAAPPRQLYGRSVTVSWSETRSQRFLGEQTAFRPFSLNLQLSIYISTAGRPFSRISAIGGGRSGSNESVGTGGVSRSGGLRTVEFKGNSIVSSSGFQASARRVVINFDSGFASCSAQAITAKQVGAKAAVWRGLIAQRPLEVESVSAGPASCTIRNGNVFGD